MSKKVVPVKTMPGLNYDFKLFEMRGRENPLDSNLTELNAAYAYYDRGYVNHGDWLAHVGRYMAAGKRVRADSKVLDVGCGFMNLPRSLYHNRNLPKIYWGLDLRATPHWGELLRWKIPTRLVRMDIVLDDPTALPGWPRRGFDITTCFEVFEHVPRSKASALLYNLYQWTKPGGVCLFSTPNAGISDSIADNHVGPDGEEREWTYADKKKLATEAGFEIEETFGTFCRMDRLPAEAHNHPTLRAARKYLSHAWYITIVAAAYPELSNNSIFVMRRPK